MPKLAQRSFLAFCCTALLWSCGQPPSTIVTPDDSTDPGNNPPPVANTYPAGPGTVKAIVLDQNAGSALAGSVVTMYQAGKAVGQFKSGQDGTFTIPKIAAGTYDFQARKPGRAGQDIYGVVVTGGTDELRVIQREAFDIKASPQPPKLLITRGDGKTPLADAIFTDKIDLRVSTAPDSKHLPPLRYIFGNLGRTPGSSFVQGTATQNTWVFSAKATDIAKVDTGEVILPNKASPNFLGGYGSAAGEKVYLELVAFDLNYNSSRYIVPITLKNTAPTAKNTVVAPTKAAATAITLRYEEGSWTTPFSVPEGRAAPSGGNLYVDLRWCYADVSDTAKPFAFDIERSLDGGQQYQRLSSVGGGNNKDCPDDPMSRPFFFRDNSPGLAVGQKALYRVIARGANTVASNLTQTTPLGLFEPKLLSPSDEAFDVPLSPNLIVQNNQLAIGADGAAYNLRLKDLKSMSSWFIPGAKLDDLLRVEQGTGPSGNNVPAGSALVFTQSGPWLTKPRQDSMIVSDPGGLYDPKKPNLLPVDNTKNQVTLPWNVLSQPLQPLRRYTLELYTAMAYKYLPEEGDRISAYSVYTWPDATKGPIRATRQVTEVYDFTTGQK